MKLVGIVALLVACYLIGRELRLQKAKQAKSTRLLGDWFLYIKDEIEYANAPLGEILEKTACFGQFKSLLFIGKVVQNRNESLNEALQLEFGRWAQEIGLDSETVDLAVDLLQTLGCDQYETEMDKLMLAEKKLRNIAQEKEEKNKQLRGFYETIAVLAGAALSLILL